MAKLYTNGHDKNISGAEIAKNSITIARGDLVTIKSGFAQKAGPADQIVGISVQDKTYGTKNQTETLAKLNYIGLDEDMTFKLKAGAGSVTQANVGAKFGILADGTVKMDATGTQVKLVKVISSTEGVFSVLKV